MTTTDDLAPACASCKQRHLAGLKCWAGRYAGNIRRWVLAEQGVVCWLGYVGRCTGLATTVDHVIPRARGGTDDAENLRPACKPCNSWRQHHDPFRPDPAPRPSGVGLSPRWQPTKPEETAS